MALKDGLASELQHEVISTRKMLQRLPKDSLGWKPHPKSFTLGTLATHITDLFSLLNTALISDDIDLAAGKSADKVEPNPEELVSRLDTYLEQGLAALKNAADDDFTTMVALRNGEHLITTLPRRALLRTLVYNHVIHHRGQLSVYLRLLDVPVPSIYGPSADEPI
ncbi:DinB family protein [Pontibacter mangrovi]|uniref:Damage-inducible protein DinB n=1 Tax=Pontibacter mangrovi TaxID=2589816 RepID=A0A501WBK8_9BACT|nr:DinB family protein [Pontibacter mangrovi]TPE42896.1 hypothetical protein FJM65_16355 [Pontibacter mangrovi]